MLNLVKKLINRFKKKSLRDKCIEAYGPEFGEIYDNLNSGIPIGGFVETLNAIKMIERVKNGK